MEQVDDETRFENTRKWAHEQVRLEVLDLRLTLRPGQNKYEWPVLGIPRMTVGP
jgi:hypothetical protein